MLTAGQPTITPRQYETIIDPSPIPSALQLFDYYVELWCALRIATERDFLPLSRLVPKQGFFLLLPPFTNVDQALVERIRIGGKTGKFRLRPSEVVDTMPPMSSSPYIAADVDDGRRFMNLSPTAAAMHIEKAGRLPYSMFEGIMHVLAFPTTLSHHFMYLCGTSIRRRVVGIMVDGFRRPVLGGFDRTYNPSGWGTPSYGRRVTSP
jgi:hypothetical protein